jgi:hypothetical protein
MKNTRFLVQVLLISGLSACGSIQPPSAGTPSEALPDLAISNLHLAMQGAPDAAPFCVTAYAAYEMRATIENRGDAAAAGIVVSVPAAGHTTRIDELPPGQSAPVFLPPSSPDITYSVSVDPQNLIQESNEGNNTASVLTITPTPPSLCPPLATPFGAYLPGTAVESSAEAVAAAAQQLAAPGFGWIGVPTPVLTELMTYAEARQRIGLGDGEDATRPAETQVWLVIFQGRWSVLPIGVPDAAPVEYEGCLHAVLAAGDGTIIANGDAVCPAPA